MPILSKPSAAAKTSLYYITAGSLLGIWSGIWYWYMRQHPPTSDVPYFFCWGFLLTGVTLLVIGFALGRISRAARDAELPPEEVTAAAAQAEQTAAARAPIMAPMNPAMPMMGNGMMPNAPVAQPIAGNPIVAPVQAPSPRGR
ncbi:MAG: hypothetical protein K2R98_27765 [Gemmataceae bacterium]|nr:hypothetical protein [Gemmataceae bacterium]